jgi:stearoyl-CoA desaturase (delta-9 desaturase)
VNFATKWFEFDPTYPMIKLLTLLKIIRPNVKPVDAKF